MKITFPSRNKAFTLIELLVVIAIIGILASVVIASLNSARAKARDAKRISDMKQVQAALEMYYADNGAYPITTGGTSGWQAECTYYGTFSNTGSGGYIPNLAPTYLPILPRDPSVLPPGRCSYLYRSNSTGSEYMFLVHTTMETGSPQALRRPSASSDSNTAAVYSSGASNW